MGRCYIDEEFLYDCCFVLERMARKAGSLRGLLRYINIEEIFEDGYPVNLLEGLSEFLWDFSREIEGIKEGLDPEKSDRVKVETNEANLSLERG